MFQLQSDKIGEQEAGIITEALFGISGEAERLEGELDLNFRLTDGAGQSYVLKIHNPAADRDFLEAQNAMIRHLDAQKPDLALPRLVPSLDGSDGGMMCDSEGHERVVRLLTWLAGETWNHVAKKGGLTLYPLGRFMGQLDQALAEFDHPALKRKFLWEMTGAAVHKKHVSMIGDDEIRAIVSDILNDFEGRVSPLLKNCPHQVIHNDANDYNVLMAPDGAVAGLIDFGDAVHSVRIAELAVAGAYGMLGRDDPIAAVLPLVAGFHETNALNDGELEILYALMRVRLAMSVCMAAKQIAENPDNDYLLISQKDVYELLRRLKDVNPHLVHFRLRDACGLEPVPGSRAVRDWLELNGGDCALVCPLIPGKDPLWIFDLDPGQSSTSQSHDPAGWWAQIEREMKLRGAKAAIGRYLEDRSVYTSDNFAADGRERRTVHMGIDIFMPPGTPVFVPLAGKVVHFNDNVEELDYGPVIILEHETDTGAKFWTKYGHLTRDSLPGLALGQRLEKGEAFARIGPFPENGNWPPHLHFQILTHLLDMGTDVFGVAPKSTLDIWESIAPDANLILGISEDCAGRVARADDYLIDKRKRHLSRNLSLSYADPLKIVKGRGQYLYDEAGNEWLDMVNNVCHVGHCHPRVVKAGQEQMAELNTNTRYLHDNIVRYAKRLTATFPDPLNVCFLVNSGSEANDLAIRLARNYTGSREMLIVDHAYHGNLSSLIDISPYKFNGRGGEGCPDQTHICTMPDGYRGAYKYSAPGMAEAYAADAHRHLEKLRVQGRKPAAFIAESILGCGGQVMLPDGYLKDVYAAVRAEGGLCIADEVQVGFGRVGHHMWGFELQGVVPDIVTLGKPIGNGHPMAAVITTPEVANAFVTGMEYFNTFGGNPVSSAIGLAVLDVVRDERLRRNALDVGEQMLVGMQAMAQSFDLVGDVRGVGLFQGMELVRDRGSLEPADREASAVVEEMKKRGILLSTDGPLHNVVKIKPPICFNAGDCDRFLTGLEESLRLVSGRSWS
ncbi:aminotransferase class III-fold pyridoxal phosphate-dependent enzyme [Aestuariispira insulae]|uniref:Hydroxylysine kinase /5-phosphonooxy-L-lysine phospho-lyase n=1 Tax=Aestuariispira insulae TaxID=1461337 RepID=A0A3D9HXW5_9PROT|nr:aminotransferase class III-fold pyridoxal phosphate-dependent enzyme [Aestuariispira insulae]RED54344.1 hydroxylysine kinase /5-phosphonooxy-L-lysine phospho-lyase [Aestuariispira insulae]